MADIHANGRMNAKITVGSVEVYSDGVDPNLVYTKGEINKLLEGKSDVNHEHEQYLTEQDISHLASKEYVNKQIENIPEVDLSDYVNNEQLMEGLESKAEKEHEHEEYLTEQDISYLATTSYVDNAINAIPEVDLSNCATKEELNEVKTSVSNGKSLLASAITDKGVNTLATDSFQVMANNIGEITTGDGPVYENPDFFEIRTNGGTNMKGLFYYYNGKNLDLSNFNTSKATTMYAMFSSCSSLTSLNLSSFNTSNVTDMRFMFSGCSLLTSLDLSSFNTSNVTDMNSMFYNCSSLTSLDLSNFNTSNVTDMNNMFQYCSSLTSLNLSSFNTSNVTNMSNMFQGQYEGKCIERLIIPNWDMTKVTTSSYTKIFGTSANYMTKLKYIDISNTNSGTLTKVKDALFAKTETTYGDIIIPSDTSQELIDALFAKYWRPVKKDGSLIFDYTSLEIYSALDEIVGIGRKSKLYFSGSPWYATKEDLEFISSDESIAYINEDNELVSVAYGSVDIYARMKSNNSIVSNTLTINISETDSYPNVIKFKAGTTSPGTNHYIKVNGNNVKLTDMDYNSATKIYTYDVGEPITSIKFNGYGNSTYGNIIRELIKLDTSNVTNMGYMFSYCTSLTSLDLSSFNTSKVTNMEEMFYSCSSLTSLDLSSFDTSNVTNMYAMFNRCTSLSSLDLSNFNTSNVTRMEYMFYNCSSLTSLDLSNFNTSSVTGKTDMLSSVPYTVDWHYDGTNYQNFTLTESQTKFSGTFPWNE